MGQRGKATPHLRFVHWRKGKLLQVMVKHSTSLVKVLLLHWTHSRSLRLLYQEGEHRQSTTVEVGWSIAVSIIKRSGPLYHALGRSSPQEVGTTSSSVASSCCEVFERTVCPPASLGSASGASSGKQQSAWEAGYQQCMSLGRCPLS